MFSITSRAGTTVYIRVIPYNTTDTGTFGIVYYIKPVLPVDPPDNATTLTADVWTIGNIPTSGGQQWFTFIATAATQYIHVTVGTLNDFNVQVYASDGSPVEGTTNVNQSIRSANMTLMVGQKYYIRVWPYNSNTGSVSYQIAFNASSTAPAWS